MVEVLGCREPTGPRRAPRTYPVQLRRAGPRRLEVPEDPESRVPPVGPVARHETSAEEEGGGGRRQAVEFVVRPKDEVLPLADPTGQDETKEKEEVSPGRPQLAARFEDKSEPEPGSRIRSEAGERNVAERRHGHPCGQQPVDEADGHRPQGAPASRLGVHCRRCRFRGAGFGDHRQQRPDAQSVSVATKSYSRIETVGKSHPPLTFTRLRESLPNDF
ncbi:PREDICTED: uncharacterized protein LOC106750378 isoform X1 [Dinoponera quadriceps]|uniref:Uncharacterized protein LOC106750378 isoform X1 n=1 Tax=Dinoponera quadriceps TaxID=609295 RepID=A0A6P3Y5H0_DINQU|nr:PREDICTED: uncharacterized protein LOC106750378 isoform X1 [Dinoponera quadriceps]XP_014486185.1 PREDICTED: uncharacterized protein LOC106750378 isoform X1 [Dinoponera quadriceps]XP_014486186.1 PREDICTED: uncharacterized protein LOC106750378 isoform X1 [Dinoponera quadriceps]